MGGVGNFNKIMMLRCQCAVLSHTGDAALAHPPLLFSFPYLIRYINGSFPMGPRWLIYPILKIVIFFFCRVKLTQSGFTSVLKTIRNLNKRDGDRATSTKKNDASPSPRVQCLLLRLVKIYLRSHMHAATLRTSAKQSY